MLAGLKFGSYAQQFIRGAVIRQFRKLSRLVGPQFEGQNLTLPHETEVELSEFGTVEDPVVDQVDFEQVRQDCLEEALKAIPEASQKVIRMFYFEGMSFAEIGRALGRTRERARQIHNKAIEQLQFRLRNADFLREEGA
jgi:RNA polymerase sigma factor (sigma-70 family)